MSNALFLSSEGEFIAYIKTADDSLPANNSSVCLVVYGENGRTRDIILEKDGAFEPGNIDEFEASGNYHLLGSDLFYV